MSEKLIQLNVENLIREYNKPEGPGPGLTKDGIVMRLLVIATLKSEGFDHEKARAFLKKIAEDDPSLGSVLRSDINYFLKD